MADLIISLLTCLRLLTTFSITSLETTYYGAEKSTKDCLFERYYRQTTSGEYRMDKIELITQPEKGSASESPQERTLQKLRNLVSEYQPDTNDEEEENETGDKQKEHEETGKEKTGESDKDGSHSEGKHSHDKVHQNNARDVNEDSKTTQETTTHEKEEDSVEYDDDGFEIPQGKIPLDGHFSTSEIRELVKLSKEEGILKDDVNFKVLDTNEEIGDKVVISEESAKDKIDNGDTKGKDNGSNGDKKAENDENNKKDEKDRSNSIDPKEKAKQYGKNLN